jgi:heme-degrading monooxygenase HmoA
MLAPARFAAVFLYDVDSAATDAFVADYGPEGRWAQLFRDGEGYLGTELWRAAQPAPEPTAPDAPTAYLVIDRWASEAAYDAFLRAHDTEYRARNAAATPLYVDEQVLGRFEAI